MAAPRPPARRVLVPFPDDLTLGDYSENGRWDCSHAFSIDEFYDGMKLALRARKDDPQGGVGVVDRVWTPAYVKEGFEDWAEQNDLDGHAHAEEAYAAWSDRWKACAAHKVGERIHEMWERILDDADLFFITDPDGVELERFDDINEAIAALARMPPEYRIEMEAQTGDLEDTRALLGWINPVLDRSTMELSTFFTVPSGKYMSKERKAVALAVAGFPAMRGDAKKGKDVYLNPANPSWVAKTLARTFETMEHGIPAKWLPRQDALGSRGATITSRVTELGCGAYGCALPTLDPTIVLKVTTDETEAQFAEKLSKTLVVPVVVKYEAVMNTGMKHQGRPIALLWREEAKDIGKLKGKTEDLVADQHTAAQDAFELVVNGQHGAELNAALDNWTRKVDAMKASAELEWLARGMLRVFKEQGVFFGDIHAGNLGKCQRDGAMRWVITDPGHIAVVQR